MAIQNFSWVIPNKLAGSAMPGKAPSPVLEYMEADVQDLAARGITSLLSLTVMPDGFGALCEGAGIRWHSYPIPDFGVPTNTASFEQIVRQVITCMHNGQSLCVHCYAGVGRTGMMLASILGLYFSIDGFDAIRRVRANRTALETDEQILFVRNFIKSAGHA
jgi:protein-tyrosine phosphatase